MSGRGISADPRKVHAVTKYPRPNDLRALRAFLGLLSYYRRFIPRFSAIAHPLYSLTRKDTPFLWSVDCETAFDQLKGQLTQAPVLAYPHFGKDFLLETNASGVVWAVKHFRHYIYGHHCTVYTDHEALKALLNTPQPSRKLARWGMALQELDLQIEYRPGKTNARADALSRFPVSLLQDDVARTQA